MSWYKTGTVTVTNGSAAVVGSGTTWLNVVAPGWGFVGPDGKVYEVLNVVSDTSLTLGRNYTGTTAAGASYDAYPTQGEIRDLAAQVLTLINDYALVRDNAGAGKFQPGSAGTPGVTTVGDLNTGMLWPAADSIGLATGGTERVRVTSTGNVGIGTSTPLTPLDINHATDSRVRLMLGGSGVMQMQSVAGANRLASNTADPLELWTNGVRRVWIGSTGLVGVGTATPATALQVNQPGAVTGQYGISVTQSSFTANSGFFDIDTVGGTIRVGSAASYPVLIHVDGAERARFDNASNFVQRAPATPPTLGANTEMVFNLTSNTNLRVSVRGTDGVTRVANITLA